MEKIFDRISVMKTLKDGIKKGYWTLEYLDNLDIYNKITRVKQSILDGSR